MRNPDSHITSDLVLIGGGHSHLFVLKHFAMNPQPGLRTTLVTRDLHTPYSGMLPGFIAGHYRFDQTHIDLLPLARYAGTRVIHAEVDGIDVENKQININGRPCLDYDLLSINVGSIPKSPLSKTPQNDQFAIKPVDQFIEAWRRVEQRLIDDEHDLQLAIIGGGAGAVELALSLDFRARQLDSKASLKLVIVTDRDSLLPSHNRRVQRQFIRILEQRAIGVKYQHFVTGFSNGQVEGSFGECLVADLVIWATHASPATWLADSGLALDGDGFVLVNACLQSVSHEGVFAVGDVASVDRYPRPRSGVFAVRQGIPLAKNLVLKFQQNALKPFHPQTQFLSLISTGGHCAVASRGPWALQGYWCWWLKDRIDRKFMRRFTELPTMPVSELDEDMMPMHCGGCGSKIGSKVLESVLDRVHQQHDIAPGFGLEHADDAALIKVPSGYNLIQSVDQFSSFIDDPYLFGKIATVHALGDLHAMGVDAHSAMVVANVVYGSEAKQAQDLYQLMSGVVDVLQLHQASLVGGHSGEAVQMSCGLSVNGFAKTDDLMLKSGLRPNDQLILTQPLGSGILFAGDMRGRAAGNWIDAALEQMLLSSWEAAKCFKQFQVRASTDVTGFGLAGHLFEMLRASNCACDIEMDQLPVYPGVLALAADGVQSSLQPQNIRIRHSILDDANFADHASYPLLFDPQTAGGLLAGVSETMAAECLQQLRSLGYQHAQIIGRVVESNKAEQPIRLA